MITVTEHDVAADSRIANALAFVRGICEEGRQVRTTLTAFYDGHGGPPVPVETLHSASIRVDGVKPEGMGTGKGVASLAEAVFEFLERWAAFSVGKDGWDIAWRRVPEIQIDDDRYAIRARVALVEPAKPEPRPRVFWREIASVTRLFRLDCDEIEARFVLKNGHVVSGFARVGSRDLLEAEAEAERDAQRRFDEMEAYRFHCEMVADTTEVEAP